MDQIKPYEYNLITLHFTMHRDCHVLYAGSSLHFTSMTEGDRSDIVQWASCERLSWFNT